MFAVNKFTRERSEPKSKAKRQSLLNETISTNFSDFISGKFFAWAFLTEKFPEIFSWALYLGSRSRLDRDRSETV